MQATLRDREGRGRGWSGIAFAVLYVAGLVPLGELLGSFGDSDATFVAYFAKDSNRIGANFDAPLIQRSAQRRLTALRQHQG